MSTAARDTIWSVDPNLPVFDIRRMTDIVARSLATRQFALVMLLSFAGLALVLAVLGVYGILSHAVAQRAPTGTMGSARVAYAPRPSRS